MPTPLRIDAHQHFWHYDPGRHAWIDDAMALIQRDFLPPDLEPLLQDMAFDGCVAVQADPSEAETRFLLGLADRHPFIRGVVGWVDLRDPKVEQQLAHYAAHPRFCGVRHIVQSEADDRFLLGDAFGRGIGLLQKYSLTYDILIYPRHLPVATTFVERFPDQRFVLDHLAKPFIKARRLEPWARDLRALARHPNVYCKLSGLVTEADWTGWTPADLHPYLDVALEAFGPDRLMVGSDWPVCLLGGSYSTVMGLAGAYVDALSHDEQAKIMGGTAQSFYGLTFP